MLAVSGLAFWYLWPAAYEFPMDDTYIHFVYAENLARTGRLMFNEPGEIGVGTTSLTWVLMLAGAVRLGIPVHLAAKVFGLLALTGLGWGLYALCLPWLKRGWSLALSLLVITSGHMLWFALSGMETVLFLASGILALLLYRQQSWAALGAVLGWLALTRPDGLALAAAIAVIDLWRWRRVRRGLWVAGLVCLLVCGPWFGYLLARTGHILPTSALGKQISSLLGIRLVITRSDTFAFLAQVPAVIYAGAWLFYLLEFVLGGMALPGPALPIGAEVGNAAYTLSIAGIIGWAAVILPLMGFFASKLWRFRTQIDLHGNVNHRILGAFTVWIVVHNLAYAFFLPIPGTASRYGSMNHVALWLALILGLRAAHNRVTLATTLKAILAAGLLMIATANTLYWNRVYDANLEHMLKVRIAATDYVRKAVSPEERCAVFDVGAMRYFSGRTILDLGGLIDPELRHYLEIGIDRYLAERGVTCLVLPGRTNTADEGWFDFAREMGLTTSKLFSLEEVRVFEIDHQRWLLGYLPTNNYQATVTIYRLNYP